MITLSESRLHTIIIESIDNFLLMESQESKSRDAAIKRVMDRFNYDRDKAREVVEDLKNTISSLKQGNCGRFLDGVARMYCDGQLRDVNTMSKLNITLKYVASDAHINEYNRKLNDLSAQDLISRFAKQVEADLANDKAKQDNKNYTGVSDYDIVRIDSFEQAKEYYEYTNPNSRWCLTYIESQFQTYTCGGINQIYFCLKKGFENIEPIVGEGCPLDEYGLSMLSVIVNEDGALVHCTSRWNHDNGGSDNVMNTDQIGDVIQMNFYETFKPNGAWNEMLENAMQRLANGEDPREVFDWCGDFKDGFERVKLGKKWNFINYECELVSPSQWFDSCQNFINGFGIVEINKKYNYINQNGKVIYKPDELDQWFDKCDPFMDGFARVWGTNGKANLVAPNGELVWKHPVDEWFEWVRYMKHGLKPVKIGDKYNVINQNGELVWNKPIDQWFDDFEDNSMGGFSKVWVYDKCNVIAPNGELIWKHPVDEWFHAISLFRKGFAKVELNGKWNLITQNGELLSQDQWFDERALEYMLEFDTDTFDDMQAKFFHQKVAEFFAKYGNDYGNVSELKIYEPGNEPYFYVIPTRHNADRCWRELQKIKRENNLSCVIRDAVDTYIVESSSAESRWQEAMSREEEVEVYRGRRGPSSSSSDGIVVDSPRVQTNDFDEFLGYY